MALIDPVSRRLSNGEAESRGSFPIYPFTLGESISETDKKLLCGMSGGKRITLEDTLRLGG